MKKNYLLICLFLFAIVGYSQVKNSNPLNYETPEDLMYNVDNEEAINMNFVPKKKQRFNQKAFLDTLAYEDFDSSYNTGGTIGKYKWTVTDVNNNGNIWEWTDDYRTGITTGAFDGAMESTTGENGFISLPSDFYNSPRPAVPDEMDTYITSSAIKLSKRANSVFVQLEQQHARCCFFTTMYWMEVSSDSTNWDTILVEGTTPVGPFVNTFTPEPEAFNISEVAAGEDEIYIRFRARRNIIYFWNIDDIAILEGPKHDLELTDARLRFNTDNYQITPEYRAVPYDLFTPMAMQATIINGGWDTARNTSLLTDITRITDLDGNPVANAVFDESELVPGGDIDPFPNGFIMTENERFSPLLNGTFRVDFGIETDSVDQIPGSETDTLLITTTDSVFSRDDGLFGIGTGISPVQINQGASVGGFDGDACGTMYILESRTQGNKVIPTSITFFVTNDASNIDIEIVPAIWGFKEDTNVLANAWLPWDFGNTTGMGLLMEGASHIVTAADTTGFLTLPLDTVGFSGLDSGQYIVGWEVLDGSTPARDVFFEVANDLSTAADQPGASSMIYHTNTGVVIGNNAATQFQPVIRLNVGTAPVQTSIDDLTNSKNKLFNVSPNPSSGEVKINLMVEEQTAYRLNVRNLLGQSVYTDEIRVNGHLTENLDLSELDKGLYIITLENAVERLQKKIILQ